MMIGPDSKAVRIAEIETRLNNLFLELSEIQSRINTDMPKGKLDPLFQNETAWSLCRGILATLNSFFSSANRQPNEQPKVVNLLSVYTNLPDDTRYTWPLVELAKILEQTACLINEFVAIACAEETSQETVPDAQDQGWTPRHSDMRPIKRRRTSSSGLRQQAEQGKNESDDGHPESIERIPVDMPSFSASSYKFVFEPNAKRRRRLG